MICRHQITKFSARVTAPPLRLLHGALVILVLWQISQFRSFREVSINTMFTQSALIPGAGSEDDPGEELACELNSCSHSGMSEHNGSPRSGSWSSFLFGFGFWLVQSTALLRFQSTVLLVLVWPHFRLTQLKMSWLVRLTSLRKT